MKKILIICLVLILSVLVYGEEKMKNRIKFSFNNKEIIVLLEDNSASRSLLAQLPLEIKFENYGNTISYLPRKLDISEAPKSCTPQIYDLTYYSPWGNLAFFTEDFRYSNGLVPLGKIEIGFTELKDIDKIENVKIEKIN